MFWLPALLIRQSSEGRSWSARYLESVTPFVKAVKEDGFFNFLGGDFAHRMVKLRPIKRWALLVCGGTVSYLAWDAWRLHQPIANSVLKVFEKGHSEAVKDTATVQRPQLHANLKALLRPDKFDCYGIVVGAHGCGKVSQA